MNDISFSTSGCGGVVCTEVEAICVSSAGAGVVCAGSAGEVSGGGSLSCSIFTTTSGDEVMVKRRAVSPTTIFDNPVERISSIKQLYIRALSDTGKALILQVERVDKGTCLSLLCALF